MADGIGPIEGLRLEARKMKEMTWAQRWVQFRTYWMWKTILLVIFIVAGISLTRNFILAQRDVVISGATVNMQTKNEAVAYLTDDYMTYLEANSRKQSISLSTGNYIDFTSGDLTYEQTVAWQSLYAMLANQDLDYLILDETAFEGLKYEGIYQELGSILSEEMLRNLSDRLSETESYDVYAEEMKSGQYGIRLDGLALTSEYGIEPETCYLVFVTNGRNLAEAETFLSYLLK